MTKKAWRLLLGLLFVASCVFAYPRPPRGMENIPALMAESTLVCKGEVVQAPAPIVSPPSQPITRMTAVAKVQADRCFKGGPPGALIPVFFDGLLPAAGGRTFVLNTGDYRLFFLKPREGKYAVSDEWFGALPISRHLGPAPNSADSMYLLELDLKAGLADPDPERVLDSIRMLGNMKHLHSESELRELLDSHDVSVRAHVWQALRRLKDYTVLPAVARFFASQPAPPHELILPRDDELFLTQLELQDEMMSIRDTSTLPYLESFAASGRDYALRASALQALRAIGSTHSAATFLKELDDPNSDNAYSAMQGLLSLADSGSIWAPSWEEFHKSPQFYAEDCREWWTAQGKQEAAEKAMKSQP